MPEEGALEAASLITVCRSCVGSDALLSDIEDLCANLDVLGSPVLGGCLNHCSEGPNCLVKGEVLFRNRTFERSVEVIERCLGSSLQLSEQALQRIRLKSDAMRRMQCGPAQDMTEAEALLSEAICKESENSGVESSSPQLQPQRLSELRALRANARASPSLSNFDGALSDLDHVLAERPASAQMHLEKAKVLRRAKKPADALASFSKALEISTTSESGFSVQECAWIRSNIDYLKDVIAQGDLAGSCASAADSGDGSGRWKVVKITGTSFDTCIYHLENHPPAVPHPHPNDAWHVSVRFGAASRDYTPVSSATDWERGRLDLLVKTYTNGEVSRKFATLQPFKLSQGACWAMVTVPKLTLSLPGLTDGLCMRQPSLPSTPAIRHIALVVGGTGVVPALQILREVAKDSQGAFSPECKAVLVYASRRACDVLALDELRAVESSAPGRIVVWHTLTDHCEDPASRDKLAQEASANFSRALSSLSCRHTFFASFWKPAAIQSGPLRTGPGEEAGLRGRPTQAMLGALLPKPGEGVKTVVCGPPQMWEDVCEMLLSLGHATADIVELHALSAEQMLASSTDVIPQRNPTQVGKKLEPVADLHDVEARIKAAQAVNGNEDALRLKAAAAAAPPPAPVEASSTPAKRNSWWSDSWWSSSTWDSSEASAWKNGSWKSGRWS